jgi:tetratricopeptide (TPR) repeat protein
VTTWLLGNHESALADFNHAHELDNESAAFISEQAVALHSLGRTDEAIAAWQQIQARDDGVTTAQAIQEKYRYPQPFYQAMQQIESLAKAK